MSVWGDLRKRSSGEVTRREDRIKDFEFQDLYPDQFSLNPIKLDLSDYVDALNELKKKNNALNKSIKKLQKIIKNINYECLG